ncbi:hypothetical protein Dvina_09030 [Dactylosporangium vinaceum]|uniref:DUF4034 domain-containing protein n=1 Tax=Dactylosporangium vinaceum TaxID=53362 RepID=A0ABV5M0E9_9ACTN|nr:hypothetical protein [Dactylosporangium vinaceum]UAB98209.1 hypothetical protein Dvina_09030 [Dactylosporangium vinaceum]
MVGFDRAFTDEYLEKAQWALADDGDPTPALDLIAGTEDADRREHAVAVLGPAGALRIELLRGMAARQAYRPERWLLLGASLSAAAWAVREDNHATPVATERLVQEQQALVAEARTALRQAAALSRDDPVPWSELTGAVICAPQHRTETADVFKRACVLAPDLYAAHTRHLTALTHRWYGTQDKVLAFARTRTADRPDGHPLHALVALAHLEGYVDGLLRGTVVGRFWRAWRYFADSTVRRETDTAAARLLAGHAAYATHPWTIPAHQAFAALYHQAGDPAAARPHLALSGRHPTTWPWRYFGDPETQFTTARATAGL